MLKFLAVLSLNLLISIPVYAQPIEQKQLTFPVKAEELLKGETHYFFEMVAPGKLAVQYPELFELDSLSLVQNPDVDLVVTKTVEMVSKPAGFFEEKQLTDVNFIGNLLGQRIHREDHHLFLIGKGSDFSYQLQVYFDADDVSTSPSKVLRAVKAAKNLDVISQSATTIMFSEKTNFPRLIKGGVSISSYLPFKENKTIVVTYQLWAISKKQAKAAEIKKSFLDEAKSMKKLIDEYKE